MKDTVYLNGKIFTIILAEEGYTQRVFAKEVEMQLEYLNKMINNRHPVGMISRKRIYDTYKKLFPKRKENDKDIFVVKELRASRKKKK